MQSWTFLPTEVVRVGRATDNNVILFSAVVSRHHAELKWSEPDGWQLVNLSPNGTYIDGEPIKTVLVADGTIFRIATSGPKIEVKVASEGTIDYEL